MPPREYREILRALDNWDSYLLQGSGLPGPRGNIELARVVADEGNLELFLRYAASAANRAPANSPYEFLAFCGVLGLGDWWPRATPSCFPPCGVTPRIRAGGFARRWPWLSSDWVMSAWSDCWRREVFRVLRQGLGYCWSVPVVALPEAGKALMEKWSADPDKEIRWIMKENLKSGSSGWVGSG